MSRTTRATAALVGVLRSPRGTRLAALPSYDARATPRRAHRRPRRGRHPRRHLVRPRDCPPAGQLHRRALPRRFDRVARPRSKPAGRPIDRHAGGLRNYRSPPRRAAARANRPAARRRPAHRARRADLIAADHADHAVAVSDAAARRVLAVAHAAAERHRQPRRIRAAAAAPAALAIAPRRRRATFRSRSMVARRLGSQLKPWIPPLLPSESSGQPRGLLTIFRILLGT